MAFLPRAAIWADQLGATNPPLRPLCGCTGFMYAVARLRHVAGGLAQKR